MTWIANWLKEIIFVVLLAGFVDLLLPNRSFERYVKLVISLLILLTLMSPVVKLIGGDPVQELQTALNQTTKELDPNMDSSSTDQIVQQGLALRKKQEAQSLEWAGQEVAREMEQQIEHKAGIQVERVKVTLAVNNQTSRQEDTVQQPAGKPVIKEVEVYLAAKNPPVTDGTPSSEGIQSTAISVPAIKQVEKVDITVKQDGALDTKHPGTGTSKDAEVQSQSGIHTTRNLEITNQLTKDWGISRTIIKIHEPEEQSGQ
ncbi:stage III sporulation protein AF [Paenibacillus sp. YPG26]|uniref:stage III sporulation protein AF n=1 Tax=Paenibacillus sp. YPG26 TaxID=2878915 RepID=UPI00204034A8|nr:stage III sporulation protein AF [Paenibacillus sp. YPG26]USB34677.1 stage III sporulation protein AF [Paenibacillus sp. YPG26]